MGFWDGFFKLAVSAEEAAGGTAAVAATGNILREGVGGALRDAKIKKTVHKRTANEFLKSLKPGDIVISGSQKGSALGTPIRLGDYFDPFAPGAKSKLLRNIGKKKLPITENDLLTTVSGSPHYHASIYKGKGVIINSDGSTVRAERLKPHLEGGKLQAFRPHKATRREINQAIQTAEKMKGTPYKSVKQQVGHAVRMMMDPTKGGKPCRKKPSGAMVCTDVVAKAYPKRFKKQIISAGEVATAKGMKPVAAYGKTKTPLRLKATSRVIGPALRSTKWGIPAAAAAGLSVSLMNRAKKKKET